MREKTEEASRAAGLKGQLQREVGLLKQVLPAPNEPIHDPLEERVGGRKGRPQEILYALPYLTRYD